MAQPKVVPLDIAEFLRVTLQIAKQSASLSTEQKAHIGMVLAMYETGRDEYLLNNGWTQNQIDAAAKSAALALANRFEDAQSQTVEGGVDLLEPPEEYDFDNFEREFDGDHHPNPD